jgi:hypothetical protein
VILVESDSAAFVQLCEVRDVLTYSFDWELLPAPRAPEWFRCVDAGRRELECLVVGADATAGAYAVAGTGEQRRVLHIDQLGRVRVLGKELMGAVGLVVALPCFRELDELPLDASLDVLRVRAAQLEAEVQSDIVQLVDARQWLLSRFTALMHDDPCANFAALRRESPPSVVTVAGWARISERPEAASSVFRAR